MEPFCKPPSLSINHQGFLLLLTRHTHIFTSPQPKEDNLFTLPIHFSGYRNTFCHPQFRFKSPSESSLLLLLHTTLPARQFLFFSSDILFEKKKKSTIWYTKKKKNCNCKSNWKRWYNKNWPGHFIFLLFVITCFYMYVFVFIVCILHFCAVRLVVLFQYPQSCYCMDRQLNFSFT